MNLLSRQPRTQEARAIRERIFNVIPAASYQMEKLFGLLDIEWSDAVNSAAVECSTTPRLLLNRQFVEEYCQADGDLFLLILHELHHVILGHTRLFTRGTEVDNIVFDAVINAMLARTVGRSVGVHLLTSLNSFDEFPNRLLRPPPGWPGSFEEAIAPLPPAEQKAFRLLYGPEDGTVTYLDIYELLRKSVSSSDSPDPTPREVDHATPGDNPETGTSGGGSQTEDVGDSEFSGGQEGELVSQKIRLGLLPKNGGTPVLLGNHGDETPENRLLRDVVRDLVDGWPPPPRRIAGRDEGKPQKTYFLESQKKPKAALQKAFTSLLRKCGIHQGRGPANYRPQLAVAERIQETVLPDPRDRRVLALRALTGAAPLIYRVSTREKRVRSEPVPIVHLYLDISGSMETYLPALTAVCREPFRRGEIKVFGFSTVVSEAKGTNLTTIPFQNTGGTSIRAVLEHFAGIPLPRRPRVMLIVTDGDVGVPPQDLVCGLKKTRVVAAITAPYQTKYLEGWVREIVRLPSF